jgi:pimeloyl-ACP methyl ester carboxylesterase
MWMLRAGAAVLLLAALAHASVSLVLARVLDRTLTVGTLAAVFAGPPPQDPFALGFRGDPQAALGLPFETVTIATPLGPAPAWLVPAAGGPPGLGAIYVHGIAGAREDGYRHLSVLHAAGIPTLLITYRNDPDAPGTPDTRYRFGLTEWEDLEAAMRWMEGRGHARIVLAAESMGGAIAARFLARSPEAGRVAALVLDSPALDGPAVAVNLAAGLGVPAPWLFLPTAMRVLALQGGPDLAEAVGLDTVAGFAGPLFLAQGTGDRLVPAAIADALLARRLGVTTHVRTTADHLQSWQAAPDIYRAELRAFLARLPGP